METIRRSYSIFRQSLSVLSKDKEILIFPFLSGVITILAFATMIFGGMTTGFFERVSGDRSLQSTFSATPGCSSGTS